MHSDTTPCTCGRSGCPLCDEAAAELLAMTPAQRLEWHWGDVASRALAGDGSAAAAMDWLQGRNAAQHARAMRGAMAMRTSTGQKAAWTSPNDSYTKAVAARQRPAAPALDPRKGLQPFTRALQRRAQAGGAR